MGAQGWIATVLGIVMALSGALVAAPAFDAAVRDGVREQGRRIRSWVELHILRLRSVSVTPQPVGTTVWVGTAHGVAPAGWPVGATTEERLEALRVYATETRRQLVDEKERRARDNRLFEMNLNKQDRDQQARLDGALELLETRSQRQTKRQLAAVPFAAIGVLLTAAGSAVGLLPLPWFVGILGASIATPLAFARLAWIAPQPTGAAAPDPSAS